MGRSLLVGHGLLGQRGFSIEVLTAGEKAAQRGPILNQSHNTNRCSLSALRLPKPFSSTPGCTLAQLCCTTAETFCVFCALGRACSTGQRVVSAQWSCTCPASTRGALDSTPSTVKENKSMETSYPRFLSMRWMRFCPSDAKTTCTEQV